MIPVIITSTLIISTVYLSLPSPPINIQNYEKNLQFNSENAYTYIQDQLDIGFRIPGTEERVNCSNYFISKFEEIDSNFTYIFHNFTTHLTECQNLLFKLNENQSNIVILSAHYDSRARATKDPILANRNNPVPGANDGASGCAVLIELAKILYLERENLSCQIWFLFFDAEDQGRDNDYGIDGWDWCEGSQRFVTDIDYYYDSETEDFECMILLDMVGGENLRFINEQYSTSSLLDEIFAIGRGLSYFYQFPTNAETQSIIDDHLSFVNFGIPSADLIINFWNNPGWPYHHTIQDDIANISKTSLEITGRTVEQFIYNNFYDDSNNFYQGNYPWGNDRNLLSLELLITIILIIAFVGVISILLIVKKTDSNKKVDLFNQK
ncbi:MAG: M28 family peptidase [Promethearchaeota archaeon]